MWRLRSAGVLQDVSNQADQPEGTSELNSPRKGVSPWSLRLTARLTEITSRLFPSPLFDVIRGSVNMEDATESSTNSLLKDGNIRMVVHFQSFYQTAQVSEPIYVVIETVLVSALCLKRSVKQSIMLFPEVFHRCSH